MALQGTLDTFSLPDVLRLLATTSKTGRLRIDGDRGRGSVWLSEGAVVDADADRTLDGTPTDEVIFELLRFGSGSFAFDGDDPSSKDGNPQDVDGLLRRADALLGEWTELEAVVPSLEHEVTLSSDLSSDEVTIDSDHWRSIVAVASGRTVGELATTLGLTELGISREVRDLADLGVVEVSRPTSLVAPPAEPVRTAADDRSHRPPIRPEPDTGGTPAVPPVSQPQRAGWLSGDRTGEIPGTPAAPPPAPAVAERSPRLDDAIASAPPPAPAPPAPATPPPPPKGGLTGRVGRNRDAGPRADGLPTDPAPKVNGARPSPPVPEAPAPTADRSPSGRPRQGGDRTALPGRRGASSPPAGGEPRRAQPPAAPASPFDTGRLGPPPAERDTGQIRPVSPSSLPPDLHWAADEGPGGPANGTAGSPFAGLSSLGPARPAARDGEVAPHVAAMSPEARAAVQSTVGPTGGSEGARGGSQGEEIAQRGRLISFLSSVR